MRWGCLLVSGGGGDERGMWITMAVSLAVGLALLVFTIAVVWWPHRG